MQTALEKKKTKRKTEKKERLKEQKKKRDKDSHKGLCLPKKKKGKVTRRTRHGETSTFTQTLRKKNETWEYAFILLCTMYG